MQPLFILQLEDSQPDADLAQMYLKRAGVVCRIHRAETRKDFEDALNSHRFDLILADYHLPQFNGMEALEIASRLSPEAPFIFVSGMLGEEIAIESLKKGATDYVLKMRLERLAPAVKRAMKEVHERAERKRAESALQETESRFRNMADYAPVMIWTAGPDKSWNYCNKLWLDFTGLTKEQSSGAGWASLVHPDDLSRALVGYDNAFRFQSPLSIEHRLLHNDGEYRWIVNRAVPRFDLQAGEKTFAGFIGSCTDITEMKQTEERLRHSAKLESLGVLAGGIAHDFNNLLTGIMGNASLALEELPVSAPVVPFVENIMRASETAAHLTRQMLAYSGKGRFIVEDVDLSYEVKQIISLLDVSIAKSVALQLDLGAGLPRVEADPGQIQQLVMNLVINASEAVDLYGAGKVQVSTSLVQVNDGICQAMLPGFHVSPGTYVMLCVSDNGEGMDAATKNRIFDPFFTTKFTGRGLGLAAVSGIVRGHKSGLALESSPGFGTEFRIYFPVVGEVEQPEREEQADRELNGSGTILVVDDQVAVARAARLTLQRYGYTVIAAQNGKEAVELFRALHSEIDLILLDMTMPVMPGDVAFREMKAIRADVPVIASSGFNEAEADLRFGSIAGLPMNGFIKKPYLPVELATIVHQVLERRIESASDDD